MAVEQFKCCVLCAMFSVPSPLPLPSHKLLSTMVEGFSSYRQMWQQSQSAESLVSVLLLADWLTGCLLFMSSELTDQVCNIKIRELLHTYTKYQLSLISHTSTFSTTDLLGPSATL